MTAKTEIYRAGAAEDHARNLERLLREVRDWARRESLRRKLGRERRELLAMSDSMLADLGISRHEAEAEARRRDIPAERLALTGDRPVGKQRA